MYCVKYSGETRPTRPNLVRATKSSVSIGITRLKGWLVWRKMEVRCKVSGGLSAEFLPDVHVQKPELWPPNRPE